MSRIRIAGKTKPKWWRWGAGSLLVAWVCFSTGALLVNGINRNLAAVPVLKHLQAAAGSANFPQTGFCPVSAGAGVVQADQPTTNMVSATGSNDCLALLQSRLACSLGETETALEQLKRAESTCPRRELLDEWAGQMAWMQGDRQAALDHWLALRHSGEFLFARANDLAQQNDLKTVRWLAERSLMQMDELNPSRVQRLYTWVAAAYQEEGDTPNVIRTYEAAVARAPEAGVLWVRLGISRRQGGQFMPAYAALQQAVALLAGGDSFLQGWAYDELGMVQLDMEEPLAAAASFDLALFWYRQSTRSSPSRMAGLEAQVRQLRMSPAAFKHWKSPPDY